ncbi:MAG: uridine kinase [Candidatus Latescibacterota bacterium]|nr:MAG: uridine kinase [Candidatus Latescibacterota bacterium]
MRRPILIGIAGGTGSGKTTAALEVKSHFQQERVVIIHHDNYYRDLSHLPFEKRARINYDHPDAFETTLLLQHLDVLRGRGVIAAPIYDYELHRRRRETREQGPADIILLEGILVLENEELRRQMDIRIFIDEDADERFMRRLVRDVRDRQRSVESIVDQYRGTVKPMFQQFVEPSKRYADLIIPHGGHNRVALDLLVVKMRDLLRTMHPTSVGQG